VKAASSADAKARREPTSDGELLSRIASGDLDTLGVLYDRHAVAVHQLVSRVGSRADADDVVQETFLRIAKIAASYQARAESARSWVLGVAFSIVRERRRASARFLRAVGRFASSDTRQASAPQGPVRSEIERYLLALDVEKREVLVLTEVMGMTGPEAAEVLGIPVGTVWTRLHHARRALRERLGASDA
jgi:RNA polymerase sigma factor (sigma-70 family)